jgi:hypothetical protein
MKRLFVCIVLLMLIAIPLNIQAGEKECLYAYEKMTIEVENAASAARAGDSCRAADGVEMALNWLGTCEVECSYSAERMRKLRAYKKDLTNSLIKYVKQCGH